MKYIPATDYSNLQDLEIYAIENHFQMIHFLYSAGKDVSNLTEFLNKCLNKTKLQPCKEFAIFKIENRYNIMEDSHTWKAEIIGFS